jgi:hypothetical protein
MYLVSAVQAVSPLLLQQQLLLLPLHFDIVALHQEPWKQSELWWLM